MPPLINESKCIRCGLCAEICPLGLFRFDKASGNPPEVAFPDECWHCNSCVLDCPKKAITLRVPLCQMLLHRDVRQIYDAGKE